MRPLALCLVLQALCGASQAAPSAKRVHAAALALERGELLESADVIASTSVSGGDVDGEAAAGATDAERALLEALRRRYQGDPRLFGPPPDQPQLPHATLAPDADAADSCDLFDEEDNEADTWGADDEHDWRGEDEDEGGDDDQAEDEVTEGAPEWPTLAAGDPENHLKEVADIAHSSSGAEQEALGETISSTVRSRRQASGDNEIDASLRSLSQAGAAAEAEAQPQAEQAKEAETKRSSGDSLHDKQPSSAGSEPLEHRPPELTQAHVDALFALLSDFLQRHTTTSTAAPPPAPAAPPPPPLPLSLPALALPPTPRFRAAAAPAPAAAAALQPPEETPAERAERRLRTLDRLMQAITIIGHVESYVSSRARSALRTLTRAYDDDFSERRERARARAAAS